jgi:site-specific recombinase XerD
LARPDQSTRNGRRDAALLCLLYDTGARVQELIDLAVADIRLQHPATVRLMGKGRKARIVPIMRQTVAILKNYMAENRMDARTVPHQALFVNHQGNSLTRPGITYIINKYMRQVQADGLSGQATITPHVLRHTKAMHLLRANITLPYIRDFLGHVDIVTTEVYAKADAEMKRAAFEKAQITHAPEAATSWQKNGDMMAWLLNLGKE